MAVAIKTPKRMAIEDIEGVLGEKGMQRFLERWAVRHVGFHNIPMLSVEALDSALEAMEGKRPIRGGELSAIATMALNYWTAVPNAKGRVQTWARMTHDKLQQERDAVRVNGQKPRRRKRGK